MKLSKEEGSLRETVEKNIINIKSHPKRLVMMKNMYVKQMMMT